MEKETPEEMLQYIQRVTELNRETSGPDLIGLYTIPRRGYSDGFPIMTVRVLQVPEDQLYNPSQPFQFELSPMPCQQYFSVNVYAFREFCARICTLLAEDNDYGRTRCRRENLDLLRIESMPSSSYCTILRMVNKLHRMCNL